MLAVETYALQASVEESMRARAAVPDMQGKLNLRNWEASSASSLRTVWLVDCQSLPDHLTNPTFSMCSDKRLSIELAAWRQLLWQMPGGRLVGELGLECRDQIRWIDMSCMICEPLTKNMKSSTLDGILGRAWTNLRPTDASTFAKMT